MGFKPVDRAPLFEEGLRDKVIEKWRSDGDLSSEGPSELFIYDRREEFDLVLEHRLDPVTLVVDPHSGLSKIRDRLAQEVEKRYRNGWSTRRKDWVNRSHVLMLQVHDGLFLTLGIGEWRSFQKAIYLLTDHPRFVSDLMKIQGEAVATLLERFLEEVSADAVIFSEPIGGNHGPLVSPAMYERLVLDSYEPVLDVLDSRGVENIILRTYANTHRLLPKIFERRFNCLWACEINPSVTDYMKLRDELGQDLRLIAGIDLDILRQEKIVVRQELTRISALLEQGGYAPLLDGRVREDIAFGMYAYYRRTLEDIVRAGS